MGVTQPSLHRRVENKNNRVVAIKIIDLEEVDDEIEDVQQEITVLSQCDSQYVTRYFGSYLKVRPSAKTVVHAGFILNATSTGNKAVDCDGVPRWRINSRSGEQRPFFSPSLSVSGDALTTLGLQWLQMQPGPLDETQIATILREVVKGLDYLHSEKKLHRDIKGLSFIFKFQLP